MSHSVKKTGTSARSYCFFVLLLMTGITFPCLAQAADEFSDFDDFEDEIQEKVDATRVADPIEPFNRSMFWLNDKLYFFALKPIVLGYKKILPEQGRVCIGNFFDNLQFPLRFINNSLQGKWAGAGTELKRFGTNTTIGLLGFFDPAEKKWDWEPCEEDFGQTFAHYGIGPGFALYLPFFGPGNLRDAIGRIPEYFVNPVKYIDPWDARLAVQGTDIINTTSMNIGVYEDLKAESMDPYQLFQDIYEQNRQKKIKE